MSKVDPSHYVSATGLECHEAQRAVLGQAGMMAYWHGCAIKYLWRCWHKNGIEDIQKAIRCLEFLIAEVEQKQEQQDKGEGL